MNETVGTQHCIGRRVLIVEDEALIAMQLEDDLRDAGCDVVGPAPSLRRALRLVEEEPLDAAVLDFRLGDGNSEPIADVLDKRGVPFLLMTGHTTNDLPPRLRRKYRLVKPVGRAALLQALEEILS